MTFQDALYAATGMGGYIRRKRKQDPWASVWESEDTTSGEIIVYFSTEAMTYKDIIATDWFVPDKTPL